MKIKTDRAWLLETMQISQDCVDIIEHHEGNENYCAPHVVIPLEAIDEVVLQLLKAKKKFLKESKHG